MKITRIKVTNYRGIEALDQPIAANGVIVKGPNGAGKTSVLRSIRAALLARDIGQDAIRLGHDRAEILVNLDDIRVRRVIATGKRSTLTVETGDGKRSIPSPQKWLNDLLGTSPLDPIELYSATPKARKSQILSALPLRVTPEEVRGWLGSEPEPAGLDYDLHGLEVIEAIRASFYERRAEANREIKTLEADLAALEAGAPPAVPGAISVADATARRLEAERAVGELEARAKRVLDRAEKTERTRKRIGEIEAEATEITPTDDTLGERHRAAHDAGCAVAQWESEVTKFERLLASARYDLDVARATARAKTAELNEALSAVDRAKTLRATADSLREALASAEEAAPSEAEIAEATSWKETAVVAERQAHEAQRRRDHEKRVDDTRKHVAELAVVAGHLDTMVHRFAKEVPATMLSKANAIPGVSLEGDSVFLDGVSIDSLSGREQLLFAVEIARRLNAQTKILVVDGLERVDREAFGEFVRTATAGGYQLIGTRVEAGDVVLETIENEEAGA